MLQSEREFQVFVVASPAADHLFWKLEWQGRGVAERQRGRGAGQVENAKQMLLMRWKMQTKRSAKFNKTADKPFVFESQLQARCGEGRGLLVAREVARANENWPEEATGYYNMKRNGIERNEATGKKQSQSNQINANISLKNYERQQWERGRERRSGRERERRRVGRVDRRQQLCVNFLAHCLHSI